MTFHSTEIISPLAMIDPTVTIGPYCAAGHAELGEGCIVHPYVVISVGSRIGAKVELFPGALVGEEPKVAGALRRKISFEKTVEIGDSSIIAAGPVVARDAEVSTLVAGSPARLVKRLAAQ